MYLILLNIITDSESVVTSRGFPACFILIGTSNLVHTFMAFMSSGIMYSPLFGQVVMNY